jgi:hypothetical protein
MLKNEKQQLTKDKWHVFSGKKIITSELSRGTV